MATVPEAKPQASTQRARQVQRIFSEIAPRYDLLNHLLSLNVDRRWRRRAVARLDWPRAPQGSFLDACAGTYDLSIELAAQSGFKGRVVAVDFAWPMLDQGRAKLGDLCVVPVCGDSLKLPFADGVFSGAMVAFGIRNLSDLDHGLRELLRTLEPGAKLVILDFALPRIPLVRSLYLFYFNHVLPLVGRIVSGHPWAYTYLPQSVKEFPGPEELARRMAAAGFRGVEWDSLTAGIATIHVGSKG